MRITALATTARARCSAPEGARPTSLPVREFPAPGHRHLDERGQPASQMKNKEPQELAPLRPKDRVPTPRDTLQCINPGP